MIILNFVFIVRDCFYPRMNLTFTQEELEKENPDEKEQREDGKPKRSKTFKDNNRPKKKLNSGKIKGKKPKAKKIKSSNK